MDCEIAPGFFAPPKTLSDLDVSESGARRAAKMSVYRSENIVALHVLVVGVPNADFEVSTLANAEVKPPSPLPLANAAKPPPAATVTLDAGVDVSPGAGAGVPPNAEDPPKVLPKDVLPNTGFPPGIEGWPKVGEEVPEGVAVVEADDGVAKPLKAFGVGIVGPDCAALANADVPDPILEPRNPFATNADGAKAGAGDAAALAGGDGDVAEGVDAEPKNEDFPNSEAAEGCAEPKADAAGAVVPED